MKATWRDLVTAALSISGGAIVWAKFYEYSWAVIGSWRSAVAVLLGLGVGIFLFSSFDFSNLSWLNMAEMVLGMVAVGVAIAGMIVTSAPLFYITAGVIGAAWLTDTVRHIRHSFMHDTSTTFHGHAQVH